MPLLRKNCYIALLVQLGILSNVASEELVTCGNVVQVDDIPDTSAWQVPTFVDDEPDQQSTPLEILHGIWPRPPFVEVEEYTGEKNSDDSVTSTRYHVNVDKLGLRCNSDLDSQGRRCPEKVLWLWRRVCGELYMAYGKKPDIQQPASVVAVELKMPSSAFDNPNEPPFQKMQEQYDIEIDVEPNWKRVTVSTYATSIHAVPRAFETLIQIMISMNTMKLDSSHGVIMTIQDEPEQPWRGLLLDTARHYFPIGYIAHVIKSMAANKLNVLHWHLSDAVAFPVDFSSVTGMTNGAHDASKVYQIEDLKYIVEFAANYSIRVVPELDMPAHTASWGKGIGDELLVYCDQLDDSNGAPEKYLKYLDKVTLDVTNDQVVLYVERLLSELADVFVDEYIHIGFDEVPLECWRQNVDMMRRMNERGIEDPKHMLETFVYQVGVYVHNVLERKLVMWQDSLDIVHWNGAAYSVPPDATVLQGWKCWDSLGQRSVYNGMYVHGYLGLQSSCWYLDWDSQWQDYYSHSSRSPEIASRILDAARQSARSKNLELPEPGELLGGEAALWTERIDITNSDCRIWPRTAAVAEKLWSDFSGIAPSSPANDSKEILEMRFKDWFQLMAKRGIQWKPLESVDAEVCVDPHTIESFCPLLDSQTLQRDVFSPKYDEFRKRIQVSFGGWVE